MTDAPDKAPGPRAESHLEAAMQRRRVELRMSWRDVSTTAGMSYEGLRAIRKGDRHPNAVTKGRIEDALQWMPGSVDAVLAGGQPTQAQPPGPTVEDRDELTALRAQLDRILDRIQEIQQRGR